MLLAIDVGNTNIVLGLFAGKKLVKTWRLPTAAKATKLPRVQGKTTEVIIASVVPAINNKLARAYPRAVFVSAANIPEIKVKLKHKKEVGADRLVNALAAYKLYGGPAIIIDFGTATTFDVITKKGEYLGGAIAPGILLARDALYEMTAKLPRIAIKAPRRVIGNSTLTAMQSGLVFGYVAMVEGLVARLATGDPRPTVIATGGLAPLICKYTKVVDKIDQELTLRGLNIIGSLRLNVSASKKHGNREVHSQVSRKRKSYV